MKTLLFEFQDGGDHVVNMDAPAESNQNNSSLLFTSASTLATEKPSTEPKTQTAPDHSDNLDMQVGAILVNKR